MKKYSRRFWSAQLPLRPDPLEDELLTSWIVRVAKAYRMKVQSFCHDLWPGVNIWNRDFDLNPNSHVLESWAFLMSVPLEVVLKTTFQSSPCVADSRLRLRNSILPLVKYHRVGRSNGLQYCPVCLAESEHYRRYWRFAFAVCCPRHQCWLHDSCPDCGSPVHFYRKEMGHRNKVKIGSLANCYNCGTNLGLCVEQMSGDGVISDELLRLSHLIEDALAVGQIRFHGGHWLYSEVFLSGLEALAKLFVTNYRDYGSKIQLEMLQCGLFHPDCEKIAAFRGLGLTRLPLRLRRTVVSGVAALVMDTQWPERFSSICDAVKLWPSVLTKDRDYVPFWVWKEMRKFSVVYSPWRNETPKHSRYSSYSAMVRYHESRVSKRVDR
ncbi:TniQ family protein [Thalassobacterium maritimum]|uniref:TniQ family protein n=1 Tax=Thalassobacterium maritimum TaxID=3041265 RepID=UPI003CE47A26